MSHKTEQTVSLHGTTDDAASGLACHAFAMNIPDSIFFPMGSS